MISCLAIVENEFKSWKLCPESVAKEHTVCSAFALVTYWKCLPLPTFTPSPKTICVPITKTCVIPFVISQSSFALALSEGVICIPKQRI